MQKSQGTSFGTLRNNFNGGIKPWERKRRWLRH